MLLMVHYGFGKCFSIGVNRYIYIHIHMGWQKREWRSVESRCSSMDDSSLPWGARATHTNKHITYTYICLRTSLCILYIIHMHVLLLDLSANALLTYVVCMYSILYICRVNWCPWLRDMRGGRVIANAHGGTTQLLAKRCGIIYPIIWLHQRAQRGPRHIGTRLHAYSDIRAKRVTIVVFCHALLYHMYMYLYIYLNICICICIVVLLIPRTILWYDDGIIADANGAGFSLITPAWHHHLYEGIFTVIFSRFILSNYKIMIGSSDYFKWQV